MINLLLRDGGDVIGTIDEEDLQLLIDQLVEEDEEDTDYYITPMTIDLLEENGATPELIEMLREAVGDSEGVDVAWEEA